MRTLLDERVGLSDAQIEVMKDTYQDYLLASRQGLPMKFANLCSSWSNGKGNVNERAVQALLAFDENDLEFSRLDGEQASGAFDAMRNAFDTDTWLRLESYLNYLRENSAGASSYPGASFARMSGTATRLLVSRCGEQ